MKESIGNSSEKIYFLLVEEVGSCMDNKNEKRFNKKYAEQYAFSFTLGNLDTFMEKEKIDSKLWPDSEQIDIEEWDRSLVILKNCNSLLIRR